MEPRASTSNEGSKKRDRNNDLKNYKKVEPKEVNSDVIEASWAERGFENGIVINCIEFSPETNIKANDGTDSISSSSNGSISPELEEILEGAKLGKIYVIPPEKKSVIDRKRNKFKEKKQKEKELAEAKELEDAKKAKAEKEEITREAREK